MPHSRATLHRTSLTGIRVGLMADASPEVTFLEEALIKQGAFVERIHLDAPWWTGETNVDIAILRVRHDPSSHRGRVIERQRLELLQALARTDRVIALLDQPLEGSLGGMWEFVLPPFRPDEVLPRMLRLLQEPRLSGTVRAGNLEMNIANRLVIVDGTVVDLTFNEFELLRILLGAGGSVLSRDELNRRLDGDESGEHPRRIDTHIHRLRIKLQGMQGLTLDTVRNVGYRLTMRPRG